MSEFSYHIHYRPGFNISKPHDLSRRSVEEKSGMDAHYVEEGQVLVLENENIGEEGGMKDVEIERVDVVTWEKKNGLWVAL